jgi:protein gp37
VSANTKIEWADHPLCLGATDAELQSEGFIKPRRPRVFCSSLADVFDNDAPEQWRVDLFRLIEDTPHLDWLLLTKRIGNAGRMMYMARGRERPILPNVLIGATVVNQEEADRDIPKLLAVPAAKRFLSMEPLLGPVDLRALRVGDRLTLDALTGCHSSSAGPGTVEECLASLPRLPGILPAIDWVIVGGESGPHARPMHPDWARSLRDQCTAAGVAFHFKQWGEWAARERVEEARSDDARALRYEAAHDMTYSRVGKKAAGRLLDGRTWDEAPT